MSKEIFEHLPGKACTRCESDMFLILPNGLCEMCMDEMDVLSEEEFNIDELPDLIDDDDDDIDDDDFQPCDECDLPDACCDFGCAIKNGVRTGNDW